MKQQLALLPSELGFLLALSSSGTDTFGKLVILGFAISFATRAINIYLFEKISILSVSSLIYRIIELLGVAMSIIGLIFGIIFPFNIYLKIPFLYHLLVSACLIGIIDVNLFIPMNNNCSDSNDVGLAS